MKREGTHTAAAATAAYLFSLALSGLAPYGAKDTVLARLLAAAAVWVFTAMPQRRFPGPPFLRKAAAAGLWTAGATTGALAGAGFAASLRVFSPFYEHPAVKAGALLAVVFAGAYAARGGFAALRGFVLCTAGLAVFLSLAALTAFAAVGGVSPVSFHALISPGTDWITDLFAVSGVLADATAFLVIVRSEDESVRIGVKKGLRIGTLAAVVCAVIPRLLYGEELLALTADPFVAALRLAPTFNVPEAAVIAATFTVTARIGLYGAAVWRTFKSRPGLVALTAVQGLIGTALLFLK